MTLTLPSGKSQTVTLVQAEPGVWRTTFEAKELGLWRASDGKLPHSPMSANSLQVRRGDLDDRLGVADHRRHRWQ